MMSVFAFIHDQRIQSCDIFYAGILLMYKCLNVIQASDRSG